MGYSQRVHHSSDVVIPHTRCTPTRIHTNTSRLFAEPRAGPSRGCGMLAPRRCDARRMLLSRVYRDARVLCLINALRLNQTKVAWRQARAGCGSAVAESARGRRATFRRSLSRVYRLSRLRAPWSLSVRKVGRCRSAGGRRSVAPRGSSNFLSRARRLRALLPRSNATSGAL